MDDTNSSQREFLAKLSVVLFAVGLLGPFAILGSTMAPGVTDKAFFCAISFGLASQLLALIFGIASRKHLCGAFGMFGSAAILVLVLAVVVSMLIVKG